MDENNIQQAKEEAVKLALQHGMALIRRDLEIHGMKADGSTVLISKSLSHDTMWSDALSAIQKMPPTSGQVDSQEYLSNWRRAEADLANYRKGEAQRVQDLLKFGSESVVKEFVDVIDNFDIALKHAPPDVSASWLEGLKQVSKQFLDVLKKRGVEKIEAVGKPFDPVLHEVIETAPGNGESHVVLEEHRAGYMMHDKVIRPARVKISQ